MSAADNRSQPTAEPVRQETRKVPVLVLDQNSTSGQRVEWLSIEVDGDLAQILDSCAIPPEDATDKSDAWDAVAAKNATLTARNRYLEARVGELEEDLGSARAQVTIARQSNGFELLAKARIEELEAALRPFAEHADYYDEADLSPGELPWRDDHPANPVFKVGQLRKARAVLPQSSGAARSTTNPE